MCGQSADELLDGATGSENLCNFYRAYTWPLCVPGHSRKVKHLVKLLNLRRNDENNLTLSDTDQKRGTPSSPRSLLSRATHLALQQLDLGSTSGHLTKVLNKQAAARSNPSVSENVRLISPPPSEFSSISSDEACQNVRYFLNVGVYNYF